MSTSWFDSRLMVHLTQEEADAIENTLARAPGCPDKDCRVCLEIKAGLAAWTKARLLLLRAGLLEKA